MLLKIIEIREFSQKMYQFVCKMTKQLTEGKKTPSEEEFLSILQSPNSHLFVLHDADENPAGMTTVGVYRTATGSKAWIEDVTVDEKYRGRGYGKKIVEHAIDFIRQAGIGEISLTSNASRIVANNLYQKMGFELYETNVYKMNLQK